MGIRILPIPCLSDNYAYLVAEEGRGEAIVVDASEAAPVLSALERERLRLAGVLSTHHHHDHVGGNEELAARFPGLPIYAHESDRGRVPGQTEAVREGVAFSIAGLSFSPLHVPGHTLGAVAYCVDGAVFTGDTLFLAGCGRLFEGTPEMMHASLTKKLAVLPPETRLYCGHEYTVSNLRFAAHVEPDNAAVAARLEAARAARERGEPTVPGTIADELATNPFLRCGTGAVRARFPGATEVEVFAAVRKAKDGFR